MKIYNQYIDILRQLLSPEEFNQTIIINKIYDYKNSKANKIRQLIDKRTNTLIIGYILIPIFIEIILKLSKIRGYVSGSFTALWLVFGTLFWIFIWDGIRRGLDGC